MTEKRMMEKLARAAYDVAEYKNVWEKAHPETRAQFAAVVRAVLLALRESSEGTLDAGWEKCDQRTQCGMGSNPKEVFQAMIDHILNESGEGK